MHYGQELLLQLLLVQNLLGGDQIIQQSRTPDIMGDAAYYIVRRDSKKCTGNFFVDDSVIGK